jgi:hypothetical protein
MKGIFVEKRIQAKNKGGKKSAKNINDYEK